MVAVVIPIFLYIFQSKLKVSPPTEEGNSSEKGPLTTGAQTGAAGSDKPGSSTTAQPNKMMSAARQLSKGNLGNCVDQNYENILLLFAL
jgi:hypothetical protein